MHPSVNSTPSTSHRPALGPAKPLAAAAARVFFCVTRGLGAKNTHRRIGNPGGACMPLSVDWLAPNTFSLAHNRRENGDTLCDPDMEFLVVGKDVYPYAFQQDGGSGHYERVDLTRRDDVVLTSEPIRQGKLTTFVSLWMANVTSQQRLQRYLESDMEPADSSAPESQDFSPTHMALVSTTEKAWYDATVLHQDGRRFFDRGGRLAWESLCRKNGTEYVAPYDRTLASGHQLLSLAPLTGTKLEPGAFVVVGREEVLQVAEVDAVGARLRALDNSVSQAYEWKDLQDQGLLVATSPGLAG